MRVLPPREFANSIYSILLSNDQRGPTTPSELTNSPTMVSSSHVIYQTLVYQGWICASKTLGPRNCMLSYAFLTIVLYYAFPHGFVQKIYQIFCDKQPIKANVATKNCEFSSVFTTPVPPFFRKGYLPRSEKKLAPEVHNGWTLGPNDPASGPNTPSKKLTWEWENLPFRCISYWTWTIFQCRFSVLKGEKQKLFRDKKPCRAWLTI